MHANYSSFIILVKGLESHVNGQEHMFAWVCECVSCIHTCIIYIYICMYVMYVCMYVIYMDKLTIIKSTAFSVPTCKVAKNFICFFFFSPLPSNSDIRSKKVPFTHIAQE